MTYGLYTSGDISNSTSTKAPLTLIVTISSSFSAVSWMKAFGVLIIATYLPSCASMMQVSSTVYVSTVGKLASSFKMKSCCMFPPANVLPLICMYIFSLRNVWDSKTYDFPLLIRSYWFLGSNVFRRWSFLISDFVNCISPLPHWFIHLFSKICAVIVGTASGCSYTYRFKNMCIFGFNVPWFSIRDMAVSYSEPFMYGIQSCLICTFFLVERRTTVGVSGIFSCPSWYTRYVLVYPLVLPLPTLFWACP